MTCVTVMRMIGGVGAGRWRVWCVTVMRVTLIIHTSTPFTHLPTAAPISIAPAGLRTTGGPRTAEKEGEGKGRGEGKEGKEGEGGREVIDVSAS